MHPFLLPFTTVVQQSIVENVPNPEYFFESFTTFSFLIPGLTICNPFPVNYHLAMFNSKFSDVFVQLIVTNILSCVVLTSQVSSTPLTSSLPKSRHLILKKHWNTCFIKICRSRELLHIWPSAGRYLLDIIVLTDEITSDQMCWTGLVAYQGFYRFSNFISSCLCICWLSFGLEHHYLLFLLYLRGKK